MVQRDKSCYLLKIKRSLVSWKRPLLEPFALSALSVEIPDCKTWEWPSPAALEFTFLRKNNKNRSVKASACLAPWKIRYSITCSRKAGEISEVVGEKQHPAVSDLGAQAARLCGSPEHQVWLEAVPPLVLLAQALAALAARLICSRSRPRTCQLSLCWEHAVASPLARLNALCFAWLHCWGTLSFFSLLNTDISK